MARKPTDGEMAILIVAVSSLPPSIVLTNGPMQGKQLRDVAMKSLTAIAEGKENEEPELR